MDSNNRFSSIFDAFIISGSDIIATTQAYTEMSSPARASLMLRSVAMSVSRPIGINSEVLNTNTAKVSPTRGNHLLKDSFFCILKIKYNWLSFIYFILQSYANNQLTVQS